jgi:dihydrofolate reductase
MTAIVAVDKNWAIGYNDRLLFHIHADLRHFKERTMSHSIVMGRKTFASLPGLLPGRTHIVLTRNTDFTHPGVVAVHNLDSSQLPDDAFVIGGAQIYAQLLPRCGAAVVTKIDAAASQADAWFPNLDETTDWICAEESPVYAENGLRYKFSFYKRLPHP